MMGGVRAQYHLRQAFTALNIFPVNKPEVLVTFTPTKFDSDGKLLDEDAKGLIFLLLQSLVSLIEALKGSTVQR